MSTPRVGMLGVGHMGGRIARRMIETGLVTCIPDGDYLTWGIPFRHLEGVELAYDDGRFSLVRLLRVEQLVCNL